MQTLQLFRDSKTFRSYDPGDTIFEEGEPGDVMYVVIEGQVGITLKGKLIETLEEGSIFGEMAIIDDSPRSAKATALTTCKLVPIDQKWFTYLIRQTPFFAIQVMTVMAERIRRLMSETVNP
ncbi:MAG: cyclic nucleotide-binding domain-containing protein [Trueperaceae bacterium]|nr:MAG: cyclic nucleotide-binding domain-containing protein [Trueperaceae bacterium]